MDCWNTKYLEKNDANFHKIIKAFSETLNDLIGNTLSINFVDESSAFYCHP